MSSYVVVSPFADSRDAGYVYRTGDTYPRQGYKPDNLRVAELASTANFLGYPLIAETKAADEAEVKTDAKPARKTSTKGTKKP